MRFELFAQLTHDAVLLERGICVNLIRETDTHTGCNAPALLRFNFVDEGLLSLSSSPVFAAIDGWLGTCGNMSVYMN